MVIGRDEFPLDLFGDRKVRLRLRITERHPHRRRGYDCWTDSDDQPLHRALGEIFTHVERWAELLVEQREQQRRRDEEERRRRDAALVDAKERHAESHRREVLARRIAEVRFVEDARAYSAALLAAADGLDPDRAADVRAWAHWAAQHADQVDPRRTLAGTPAPPDPSRDELRPYLPAGFWYY